MTFIGDKLLNLLQLSKDGRRPPVVFFTTAWATLMQLWSDEIRTTGKPLAALTRETASWAPTWQTWSPTSSPGSTSPDYSIVPPLGAGSSKERNLQAELGKARTWAASMQSERDRLQNELKAQTRGRSRSQARGKGGRGDRDGRDQYQEGAYSKAAPPRKGGKGGQHRRR